MAMNADKNDAVWLGIDLGTTSVKVVLLNVGGDVIYAQTSSTMADVQSDIGNLGREQNPKQIMKTLHDLTMPALDEFKHRITGIGITGQMHGVVMWGHSCGDTTDLKSLDKLDNLHVSNLYTWQDQRCTPQFLETLPKPSNLNQPLSTGYGCATLFWLSRNQPELFKCDQFTCCGTIMDYLVTILCDLNHPTTSDQLAANLGYFDQTAVAWDSCLNEAKEFPRHLLPKIVPAGTVVGHVSASMNGWPQGVPVFVAMGDVQCAMYAILQREEDAAVNISTSIQLGFVIPDRDIEKVREESPKSMSFFPYFGGKHLALCAGLNGGNAVQHFVECVAKWMLDLGLTKNADANSLLPKLQKLAEDSAMITDDTKPVRVRPVFFGERHNTSETGSILDLNSTNFNNIGGIFRAVCEGVVDHLHSMVPASYLLSRGIQRLLVTGSVPVSNPFVKQQLVKCYAKESELSVVIGTEGTDAAGSAVGAARMVRDTSERLT